MLPADQLPGAACALRASALAPSTELGISGATDDRGLLLCAVFVCCLEFGSLEDLLGLGEWSLCFVVLLLTTHGLKSAAMVLRNYEYAHP
jgi:hypothetical protein